MNELTSLASDILDRCRLAGATDAELRLHQGRESEFEVREGRIDRLVEGSPRSLSLRVWLGDRSASVQATELGLATVDRLVREALELAPFTDPVPEQALPDAAWLAQEIPTLELLDPALEELSVDARVDRLREAEAVSLAADPRVTRSGGAGWADASSTSVLANSRGFLGAVRGGWARMHVEAIADDADGVKRNGVWYSVARFLEDLDGPADIGRLAGERAVRMLGAAPIPTARMPIVFDPLAGAALLSTLFQVISGAAVESGASFLANALDRPIASPLVTVIDDPLRPRGLGSRPYDGEGLPVRRTVFVDEGRLTTFALNSYHARKLGRTPTGHAGGGGESPSNLYLQPGSTSAASILGEVKRGFYCESMMGFGFNPSTGDFSRGASGFLIEDGRLTRPVSGVTLSANLGDMLKGIDAIGDDLIFRRSVVAPTFRIREMTLAGV